MVKKIVTFIFILILLNTISTYTVNAHSVLESSNPHASEELEEPVEKIELYFSTKIENGSRFHLANSKGKKIKPSSININDNVIIGRFNNELVPDTYQVNWEVLGADGHLMKNHYSFTIMEGEGSIDSNSETVSESSVSSSDEELSPSQAEQKPSEENTVQGINEEKKQSPFIYGLITFLVIVMVIFASWLGFSRNKN